MKTFAESTVTKVILISLAIDLLVALGPMLEAHAVDPWALGVAAVKSLGLLLGNALRPDVRTGISMLDRRNPQ